MRTLDTKEIKNLQNILSRKRKKNGIEKLRTAIYARKSAEDEKNTSLPTQIENCKKFIEKYDFLQLTAVLEEDNVSGMFTTREKYQQLMTMAENREIDVIVVMKLDRLNRDLDNATTTIKLLEQYNCVLLAGDDVSNAQTPEGEFMRSILLAHNQYHARRVASDVMYSECNNVKNNMTAGATPPYGYKYVNKYFEINEDEAPAIRILFKRIAEGYSYKNVIDELTSLGYKTRAGGTFSYSTLNTLLRNEKFYGTYIYNRTDGKRRKDRVLNEVFDEIRNANAIPPIIDKELFDKVQETLKEHSNCRPKTKSNYVLSGLVFCKNCGSPICGEQSKTGSSRKVYRTYFCKNHKGKFNKTCPTKSINADYLEYSVKNIVLNSVNDYLSKNALSSNVFETVKKDYNAQKADLAKRIDSLEKQTTKFLTQASNTTIKHLASEYEKQASNCIQAKNNYTEKLNEIDTHIVNLNNLQNKFENGSAQLSMDDLFYNADKTRVLLHTFIKRIEIDDKNNDIEIIFNC